MDIIVKKLEPKQRNNCFFDTVLQSEKVYH